MRAVVLSENLKKIIALLTKKNESQKKDHTGEASIISVPLLLYAVICIYNHLKINPVSCLVKDFAGSLFGVHKTFR